MHATKNFVLLALLCIAIQVNSARVSQDCLWGRTTAAKCCKNIPNGDSTHLADPENCNNFYICRNNKPVLYSCNPGEVWNVDDQKCVEPSDANKCPQVTA